MKLQSNFNFTKLCPKISDDQLNMINAKVDTLVNLADANGKKLLKRIAPYQVLNTAYLWTIIYTIDGKHDC